MLKKRLDRILIGLNNRAYFAFYSIQSIYRIKRINGSKIILLGSPFHNNLGDNAQTICTMEWINKYFGEYTAIHFMDSPLERHGCRLLKRLSKYINKNDIIFLHSGYHTTNLYPQVEHIQSEAFRLFPDNRIVVFPQTVFFDNDRYMNEVKRIYNTHKKTFFMCRDSKSYEIANTMFRSFRVVLYPDIVALWIGNKKIEEKENEITRKGVYFCLRTGKESRITKEEVQIIKGALLDYQIDEGDTDSNKSVYSVINNRERLVLDYIRNLSRFKLVITDRFHGMIFSLIANTPVIVLPTNDHKLEYGIKWFAELEEFKDYVFFANSSDEVLTYAKMILESCNTKLLSSYFADNIFGKLYNEIIQWMQ